MRDAFAEFIVEVGGLRDDLFVIDGDCSHSTRSYKFQQRFPSRFLNAGIAEQNMFGIAAGLAVRGIVPIVCGFSALIVSRGLDQIVQSIAYPNLNVKIVGHYSGVTASFEGAPHHSILDIAVMRAIPNMTILTPADDADVSSTMDEALNLVGPTYIRLSRNPCLPLSTNSVGDNSNRDFRFWSYGEDVCLVTQGTITSECLKAAELLKLSGINTSVLSVLKLKPLSAAKIENILSKFGRVITVEDHSVYGGLGSAVAELLAGKRGTRFAALGVPDIFTESGGYQELLAKLGLDAANIAERVCSQM